MRLKALLLAVCLMMAGTCGLSAQNVHVVQAGETIESIAAKYNLAPEEIIGANPNAADFCFAGLKLALPEPGATASAAGFGALPTSENIRDHYRRSSICMLLLVHSDKPYADAMVRVFNDFPKPLRYNEHNLDVRVVEVTGKQKKDDIERILQNYSVGRGVVSRWFNRNSLGHMNMDLIHERGGYGAFHHDYQRAMNTVRGTATLRDEGVELLESTFVLVCDMEYAEQNKGFKIGSVLAGIGSVALMAASAYMEYDSYQEASKGNYEKAASKQGASQLLSAGSQLTAAGASALADLSKFRVNIHSYLYKLNWDQNRTASVFNTYWVDETTPGAEAERRKKSFDNANFGLEYIGDYSKASSKTKLVSCTDVDQVVLDVCHRSVSESIKALADKFIVFRPRTPFYCENGMIYSYIGSKEDVVADKKYEVVKRTRNKNGKVEYKRVGAVKALRPWHNADISFDRYFDSDEKGTAFQIIKGKYEDLAQTPGLQIREMN